MPFSINEQRYNTANPIMCQEKSDYKAALSRLKSMG